MSALLLASLTVEEKPPDARSNMCFSFFSLSRTVRARANDVMCEIWDTYAVWTSWPAEFMYIILIFRQPYSFSARCTDDGADSSWSQIMQALPSKRPDIAAQGPEYSVPAIGCVAT